MRWQGQELGVADAAALPGMENLDGLVRSVTTNSDGRTDGPVIPKGELEVGVYELLFHAGSYLDDAGAPGESPRFLDLIPIRFGIADVAEHYHVPLLLAGYSYSTYRGS